MERWRGVKEFEGVYEVSTKGRIRRTKDKYIIKTQLRNGYPTVVLYKGEKQKTRSIGRMIAETFILNKDNCKFVGYKDGNRKNTNLENIYWKAERTDLQGILNAEYQFDITSVNLKTKERKRYFKTSQFRKEGFKREDVWRCLAGIGENKTRGVAWYKTEDLKNGIINI